MKEERTMSNQKHTPGPWYRYDNHKKEKGRFGNMVCTDARPQRVFGQNDEFFAPFIVCQPAMLSNVPLNSGELDANINLIVAAPEMLEAIKRTKELIERAFPAYNNPKSEKAYSFEAYYLMDKIQMILNTL